VDGKYSTNFQSLQRKKCSKSKFGIDCRMRMYDNLQYQSVVRFERTVSDRFSRSRSTVFFQVPLPLIRFSGPLRSAPLRSAPLPLRSYALPTSSHYLYCSSKIWLLQVNFDTKQILEMSRKVPDNDIFIGTWMLAAVFIITIIILITMNNLCDICMHVFASVA